MVNCTCCDDWSASEWDDLSEFYTVQIRSFFDEFRPKNGGFIESNRLTMEYSFEDGKRLHLMPDGVHKMARSPNSDSKEFSTSLMVDTDVIFNYICNRRFEIEKTCCNKF